MNPVSNMSPRFRGASPALTTGLFAYRIPQKNDQIVSEMADWTSDLGYPFPQARDQKACLFSQDDQWIFQGDDETQIKTHPNETPDDIQRLQEHFSRLQNHFKQHDISPLETSMKGGNVYLGISEENNPWVLVGERIVNTNGSDAKEKIARDLGLKSTKFITSIPQQPNQFEYDIDTFLRPLDGKTVLVYDPKTSQDFLEAHHLERLTSIGIDQQQQQHFTDIHQKLEAAGYTVIKAPGLFQYQGRTALGDETRFNLTLLNAVVLSNPNTGKLIYYTMDPAKQDLKNTFADWLKNACPEIEDVVYINGGPAVQPQEITNDGPTFYPNRMIEIFNRHKAGLHCLFAELINLPLWRNINQLPANQTP